MVATPDGGTGARPVDPPASCLMALVAAVAGGWLSAGGTGGACRGGAAALAVSFGFGEAVCVAGVGVEPEGMATVACSIFCFGGSFATGGACTGAATPPVGPLAVDSAGRTVAAEGAGGIGKVFGQAGGTVAPCPAGAFATALGAMTEGAEDAALAAAGGDGAGRAALFPSPVEAGPPGGCFAGLAGLDVGGGGSDAAAFAGVAGREAASEDAVAGAGTAEGVGALAGMGGEAMVSLAVEAAVVAWGSAPARARTSDSSSGAIIRAIRWHRRPAKRAMHRPFRTSLGWPRRISVTGPRRPWLARQRTAAEAAPRTCPAAWTGATTMRVRAWARSLSAVRLASWRGKKEARTRAFELPLSAWAEGSTQAARCCPSRHRRHPDRVDWPETALGSPSPRSLRAVVHRQDARLSASRVHPMALPAASCQVRLRDSAILSRLPA